MSADAESPPPFPANPVLLGDEDLDWSAMERRRRGRSFLQVQLVGWGLFSIGYFLALKIFWDSALLAFVMCALLIPGYVLLTLGLRKIYRRRRLFSAIERRTVLVVMGACLAAAAVQLTLSEFALRLATVLAGMEEEVSVRTIQRLVFHLMVFIGWSFAYFWGGAESRRRTEAKRREEAMVAAERSELQMLRFQLNPHFLFNSLNRITGEIEERPQVALEMTHKLAEFMRHTLDHRGEILVPLAHEVEGLRKYLSIEQERFEGELEVVFAVDEVAEEVLVPNLLLQPLVENAVKHGMRTSEPPWRVEIEARQEDGGLRFEVKSPGRLERQAVQAGERGGSGVGLEVVRRRLALHYPDQHKFSLEEAGKEVLARIEVSGDGC